MFADDVGLLPSHMFTRMLQQSQRTPERFADFASDLFRVMAFGGHVGFEEVNWFNGGLFDDDTALPLTKSDIDTVLAASRLDWSEIDPSILGTLFERGLDPGKRAQLGAHYTDRDKIMLLVEPVVTRPLLAEWAGGESRDRLWAGKCGCRQVTLHSQEPAERSRAPVPIVPGLGYGRSRCSTPHAAPATSYIWPCRRSKIWSTRFRSRRRRSASSARFPR